MADLAGGSSVIWTRRLTCPATVALPVLARDEGRRRGEGGGAPLAVGRRGRPRRRRGSGRRRSGRLGEVDGGGGRSCWVRDADDCGGRHLPCYLDPGEEEEGADGDDGSVGQGGGRGERSEGEEVAARREERGAGEERRRRGSTK